jgi:hypothetical protein
MGDELVLTGETAGRLLSEGYEEFCDFTAMDNGAAEVLAAHEGKLAFPSVVEISASQAQLLSKHEGGLSFSALEQLSIEAANHLAASRGDLELSGSGIVNAAEEVVRALSAHVGGTLRLGLVELTKSSARILAGRASPLALPDLEALAEDAADELSTYGGPLSVNESLLASSCDLHQRLVRHPSIWVSPVVISEGETAMAAEGKDPEEVVAAADGFSFFSESCEYYGDVTEAVLKMFSKAPWKPMCSVNGLWLGEQYQGRTYYFIGTKKQVLHRIAELT